MRQKIIFNYKKYQKIQLPMSRCSYFEFAQKVTELEHQNMAFFMFLPKVSITDLRYKFLTLFFGISIKKLHLDKDLLKSLSIGDWVGSRKVKNWNHSKFFDHGYSNFPLSCFKISKYRSVENFIDYQLMLVLVIFLYHILK